MQKYYVYRYGSNAANQSMDNGPRHVATVQANTSDEATDLARQRVTVYNNQYLDARLAEEVDDDRVEVIE